MAFQVLQVPLTDEDNGMLPKIAWKNIVELSKTCNPTLARNSTIGWLKSNPKKTLRNLEDLFRKENIEIYLLAREIDDEDEDDKGKKLSLPHLHPKGKIKKKNLKYKCVWTCGSEESCLKELRIGSKTYKENYKKLLKTGIQIEDKSSFKKLFKEYKKKETINSQLALNNTKVKVIDADIRDILNNQLSSARENTKQDPVTRIIAAGPKGEALFGFYVKVDEQDMLVSQLGLLLKFTETINKLNQVDMIKQSKIVDITNKSTWHF